MTTNLPESDTGTKQRDLIKLMHACYPRDLEHQALPLGRFGLEAESRWYTAHIDAPTGHRIVIEHKTHAEAMEYWRWEWVLIDIQELVEALAMIDVELPDETPPVDWDLFAGAGDMD